MTNLVEIGLNNLLMAAVLAVVAAVVGRWAKRPALTHGLWVLVFLKLITPPFVVVPMGWLDSTPAEVMPSPELEVGMLQPATPIRFPWDVEENDAAFEQAERMIPLPEVTEQPTAWVAPEPESTVSAWFNSFPWLQTLAWLWVATSALWFVVAAMRVRRFRTLLKSARPAPQEIQEETARLAHRLGLSKSPAVLLVHGSLSPALWVVGRQRLILVPTCLLGRLSSEQRATLLTHELAHLRRRDHWVRCLELVVLGLYWWCPLVWWARAELREAEEECCDAWVVWALPDAARAYAFALVETVDFLAGAPPALPQLASGFGPVQRLKRRLTMILRGTAPRTLTVAGGVLLVALAMGVLPLVPTWGQEAQREREQERKKEVERKKETERREEGGERGEQAERLRKMQAELEEARRQLEQQRAVLERKAAELQRAADELRSRERPAESKERPDPKPRPETPRPIGPGGEGGRGAPPKGFGGGFGFGGAPMDLERRLREMERKLENLLDEMTALRRDLSKGPAFGAPGMPGKGPQPRPKEPGTPASPRRGGEGLGAAPGAGGLPGTGPGVDPRFIPGPAGAPPVPPRPRDPNNPLRD